MKLHYYALWISVIFVASVSVASPSINRPKPAIQTVVVPLERSLRVAKEWNEVNEERAGVTETAKSFFTPSVVSPATIKSWLSSKKSPIDAFKWLQLNFAGTNLFKMSKFKTWVDYMKRLNTNNPEEAMLSLLRTRYTDDALSQMLIEAKRGSDTDEIITKLQAEQLKFWASKEKSADDVFTLLQLNKVDDKLFRNPEFALWVKYVDDVNTPGKAMTMVSTMLTHYSDDALSQMLIAAKKASRTKSLATKLQAEQIRRWLSNKTPADEVFTLLRLNKARNFDDISEFTLWAKYVDDLKMPDKEKTMMSILSSHYSDDALSQLLIAAKKSSATEDIATKLQADQLRVWVSKEKFTDDVFTLLRLDQLKKGADKIFDNPEFILWSKYLDDLNILRKEKTILSTLSTSYSDEVVTAMIAAAKTSPRMKTMATKMETLQTNKWLADKISPVDVFKFYQLDKAGDSLLTSPKLNTWIDYMKEFNNKNPTEKVTILSTFTKHYGDDGLAKIFIAAKRVHSTNKLATDFQNAQINRWLKTKQKTADVAKWLGEDVKNPSPLFQDFMKKSIAQRLAPRRTG